MYLDRYDSGSFAIVAYMDGRTMDAVRRNNWVEAIEYARNFVKQHKDIDHAVFMSSESDSEERHVVDLFDEDELLKLYLSL